MNRLTESRNNSLITRTKTRVLMSLSKGTLPSNLDEPSGHHHLIDKKVAVVTQSRHHTPSGHMVLRGLANQHS